MFVSDEKFNEIGKYIFTYTDEFIDLICINYELPEWFMCKYHKNLNWDHICMYQGLSIEFVKEHLLYINWKAMSVSRNLSTEFVREFINKLDWDSITKYIDLNKAFIQEFYDKLNFKILKQRNLIEEFMTDTEFELLEVMGKLTE